MTDRPCRTTQHCAVHGFCHRCDQNLTDAAKLIVQAIPVAGVPDNLAGSAYAKIMAALDEHAAKASDIYDKRVKQRMSGKVIASLRKALAEGAITLRKVEAPITQAHRMVYVGGCTCAPGPEGQHEGHCGYMPDDSPLCPPGVHSIFDPCPGGCNEPVDENDDTCDLGYVGCVGRHDNHPVEDAVPDDGEDDCALPYLMSCDCTHVTGCEFPRKERGE